MAVLGMLSFTLEVPDIEEGVRFYSDAGLIPAVEGDVARLRCEGQERASITLLGGFASKRLHHVALRAEDLGAIAERVPRFGGRLVTAPEGFPDSGLWVEDPHGMLLHLVEHPATPYCKMAPPSRSMRPDVSRASGGRRCCRQGPMVRFTRSGSAMSLSFRRMCRSACVS
jgi:catechol 2,3-dioxygenase